MTTYIIATPTSATAAERLAQVSAAQNIFSDEQHSIWIVRLQTVEDSASFEALTSDESLPLSLLKLPDGIVPATPEPPDALAAQALALDVALQGLG